MIGSSHTATEASSLSSRSICDLPMWQIQTKNKTAQSSVVSELLGQERTVMVARDAGAIQLTHTRPKKVVRQIYPCLAPVSNIDHEHVTCQTSLPPIPWPNSYSQSICGHMICQIAYHSDAIKMRCCSSCTTIIINLINNSDLYNNYVAIIT